MKARSDPLAKSRTNLQRSGGYCHPSDNHCEAFGLSEGGFFEILNIDSLRDPFQYELLPGRLREPLEIHLRLSLPFDKIQPKHWLVELLQKAEEEIKKINDLMNS